MEDLNRLFFFFFLFTCMSAMNKKKALAARLICSYRKRGRKVNTPYLAVL